MRGAAVALILCAVLPGCDEPAEPTDAGGITVAPSPITVSGATRFVGSTTFVNDASPHLHSVVRAVNLRAPADTAMFGSCFLYVRLYTTPNRTGAPTFDQSKGSPVCTAEARVTVIAPRDSAVAFRELTTGGPGRLAPSGHYFVSLIIAPGGAATLTDAGEVNLP